MLSFTELAEFLAPEFAPVRFKTWFYRVDLKKKIDFCIDPGEFVNCFWKSPEELLKIYRAGKSLMVPPTRWVLEKLKKATK